jgi:predicted RNA-binding protein with PIN domain
MADSYLIDGYNLIHALGMIQRNLAPGGLEESRRRLLVFLAEAFGKSASVTIVFDAQHAPRNVSRWQTHQGLHIEFAPAGQSADDRIETLIDEVAEPAALVVISNDMRLQNAARRRGARSWSHEALLDFLGRNQAPEAPPRTTTGDPEKSEQMSPEEMKSWMEEFGHLQDDPELKEFFDLDRFE